MKVIKDDTVQTWTLVPFNDAESQVVAAVAGAIKPKTKMDYGGASQDGEGDKFYAVHLHAGSKAVRKTEYGPNGGSVTQTVHEGGVELVLTGSTEDDKYAVNGISNTCYMGSGGLIFLGTTEVEGKLALVTTGKFCQHCGANMISMGRCEWGTCKACAEKCKHHYIKGAIHGGGLDIGVGEFCDKCGMGRPKPEGERQKSVLEQHLAVQKELGIPILYGPDAPAQTPEEAVMLGRLSRRYSKAKARAGG